MGANIQSLPGGIRLVTDPKFGVPLFGSGAPVIKTRVFKLDTAQTTPVEINIAGNFLWAFAATDLVSEIDVQFNDQQNDAIPVTSGFGIGGINYGKIYIAWAAQPGKTVTIMYGMLPSINNFFVNPANALNTVNVSGVVNVAIAKEQAIKSAADVTLTVPGTGVITSTQLLAANTKRLFAIIILLSVSGAFLSAPDANHDMRIGDSTTLIQGLSMGQTATAVASVGTVLTLQTTAQINAIGIAQAAGPNGVAKFALLEIQDS